MKTETLERLATVLNDFARGHDDALGDHLHHLDSHLQDEGLLYWDSKNGYTCRLGASWTEALKLIAHVLNAFSGGNANAQSEGLRQLTRYTIDNELLDLSHDDGSIIVPGSEPESQVVWMTQEEYDMHAELLARADAILSRYAE